MSGLQHKKGKGLDLRQFGRAQIERASHIIWEEATQLWLVEVLTGPYAGQTLTRKLWMLGVGSETVAHLAVPEAGDDSPLGFDDYEEAVQAEVAFLDALRLQGAF